MKYNCGDDGTALCQLQKLRQHSSRLCTRWRVRRTKADQSRSRSGTSHEWHRCISLLRDRWHQRHRTTLLLDCSTLCRRKLIHERLCCRRTAETPPEIRAVAENVDLVVRTSTLTLLDLWGGRTPTSVMSALPSVSMFREVQLVHETGFFPGLSSIDDNYQEVSVSCYRGPRKVSHYHIIKIVLNCIKPANEIRFSSSS